LSKAIVISFDRWHAGFLGLYGNPWVDTPALDAFAIRSAVFDQHFAENLAEQAAQHAWWTGRYQFPLSAEQQRREPTWLKGLAERKVASSLLYDPAAVLPIDPQLFSSSRSVSLDDANQIHFEEDAPKFVKTAVLRIQQMGRRLEQSELLWIHAGGLPIDAHSLAYEELYADDAPPQNSRKTNSPVRVEASDDEEFETDSDVEMDDDVNSEEDESESDDRESEHDDEDIVFPPRFWRRARSSPRELADASLRGVGWDLAALKAAQPGSPGDNLEPAVNWQERRDLYSGQVTQWDAWVGKIIEAALALAESTPVMVVFTAAAGEHLGEHAEIGQAPVLFEESIRVPLIIRVPNSDPFTGRRLALSTAADLPATILDWFQVPLPESVSLDGLSLLPQVQDDLPLERQTVVVGNDTHGGVRSKEFYLRAALQEGANDESVFVKPDDRWDADNMVRQLPDAADSLRTQWHAIADQIRQRAAVVENRE
jgi:arylsulfatase A-like enzyme